MVGGSQLKVLMDTAHRCPNQTAREPWQSRSQALGVDGRPIDAPSGPLLAWCTLATSQQDHMPQGGHLCPDALCRSGLRGWLVLRAARSACKTLCALWSRSCARRSGTLQGDPLNPARALPGCNSPGACRRSLRLSS